MSPKLGPLGVFDSGLGGLTVLKAIHTHLPQLSTTYLGDNGRAPYGSRSPEDIFAYTRQAVEWLWNAGCPLVIVACNTASAQALRRIQQDVLPASYPNERVLGVVRPGAEALANQSTSKHVGVFGTHATMTSHAYQAELTHLDLAVHVTEIAIPDLAGYVEAGEEQSTAAHAAVAAACAAMIAADHHIDTVLLGCTHFAFVTELFAAGLPGVRVLTQEALVADALASYLVRHPGLADRLEQRAERRYYTTGSVADVSGHASRFFGAPATFLPLTFSP